MWAGLSCCCNLTDLQGLLWGIAFSWGFAIVTHIVWGLSNSFFFSHSISSVDQAKATHIFSLNILTLSNKPSCTSLPSHCSLYWTQSFSSNSPYVLFLISSVYQVFYSDVNKIFNLSCKHWYLIYRVLSNNVVFCLLREYQGIISALVFSDCWQPNLLAVPVHLWCAGLLCICYWWTRLFFNGYFRSFGTEFLKYWKLFGSLLLLCLFQYFLLNFSCILTCEIPSEFLQLWSSGFQFPLKMASLTLFHLTFTTSFHSTQWFF